MNHKNFSISLLHFDDVNRANEISNIMKDNLLTPKKFYASTPSQKMEYSKNGFLIGYHDINIIKNWIGNSLNKIFVIKNLENEENPIVGYTLILFTKEIIKEVQEYSNKMIFKDNYSTDIINNGNFNYLIQIAILKEYQKMGLGSKMFNMIFKEIKDPIISYVMKSPIVNKISLYTHLKLGFTYMGPYTGEYLGTKDGKFENFQSIGLIHRKSSSPMKEREDILKLMTEII